MGKKNNNLNAAKAAKNDEFYTSLNSVENELRHYNEHFKNKVVLCNCNDAAHTGFAIYFALKFEVLGLKELICTEYNSNGHGFVYRYHGEKKGDYIPLVEEWDKTQLEGDGGFNSAEGLSLIDEADIIATNPPFSLFRDFITILLERDKKFIIIGNMNAVTYKEIFPLIKDNQVWLGATGFVTGLHLHFEIRKQCNCYGKVLNPADYIGIPNKVGIYNSDNYKIDNFKKGDIIYTKCLFTGAENSQDNSSLIQKFDKQFWVYNSSLNEEKNIMRVIICYIEGDELLVECDSVNDENKQFWINKKEVKKCQ